MGPRPSRTAVAAPPTPTPLTCSMLKKTGTMSQYWKPEPRMARTSPCSTAVSRMPTNADMSMATSRPSLSEEMFMNE